MINVIIQTFPVLKTKQTHTGPSSVMSRRHCLFVQPHQWGGNKCWSRSFFPFFPWPPPLDSLITSTFWCLDLFIPPNNCAYRFMQSPLITHPPSGVLLQARFFFSVLISGLSFFSKWLTPRCTGTNFFTKVHLEKSWHCDPRLVFHRSSDGWGTFPCLQVCPWWLKSNSLKYLILFFFTARRLEYWP